jgi:CRP-like cAMP-binding protein
MVEQDQLRQLVPINELAANLQDQLLAQAHVLEFAPTTVIFRQGDRDHLTYYLLDGAVDLLTNNQPFKKIDASELAARYPLAQLQPRQMSAVASSPVRCLTVDRRVLDNLMALSRTPAARTAPTPQSKQSPSVDWLSVLLGSELFKRIPPANVEALLDTLSTVSMNADDLVIRQGDPGDHYYIVQTGKCEVLRTLPDGNAVKLAELHPGDAFGEEALVTSARRNASVRMMTDGDLARLTREDFVRLIRQPVLRTLSVEEAMDRIRCGQATALDVRFASEHMQSCLPGSINVPLAQLRDAAAEKLDKDQEYIVYCDTGGRSSVAAFILTELGYTARYVEGGLAQGMEKLGRPLTSLPAQGACAKARAGEDPVEAEVQVSLITTDIAKADLQIGTLERLIDTELSAIESQRIAKLLSEVSDLRSQLEMAKKVAESTARNAQEGQEKKFKEMEEQTARRLQENERSLDNIYQQKAAEMAKVKRLKAKIEEQIKAERARLASQSAESHQRMEEAQRIQAAAEAHLKEQQEREESLTQQIAKEMEDKTAKLHEETERSLDDIHQQKEQEMAKVKRLKAKIEEQIKAERARLASQSAESHQRMDEAKRIQAKAEARLQEQQEREESLTQQIAKEIEQERRRMEAEFAAAAEHLIQAQQMRQDTLAAKQGAELEAQRIIAEFKAAQEARQAEDHARIAAERERLQQEARAVQQMLDASQQAKAEAENILRDVEKKAAQLRSQATAGGSGEADSYRAEIKRIQAQAMDASKRLEDATTKEVVAQARQRENAKRFEHARHQELQIVENLQAELQQWVAEQEKILSSTAHREETEKQHENVERIRLRAEQAKKGKQAHAQALLDELASKLGEMED